MSCLLPAPMQLRQEPQAAAVHWQPEPAWTQVDLSGTQCFAASMRPLVEWTAVAHLQASWVLPACFAAMLRRQESRQGSMKWPGLAKPRVAREWLRAACYSLTA